jgi:phage terminase small subunit
MNNPEYLTDRQRRYVTGLARGLDSRAAALTAGYSASFSRVAAHRVSEKPAVVAALEAIHSDARREAVYDLTKEVAEIDKAILFAYAQKNSMAIAKLLESKDKLFGLYIDRYQEVPVDLKGALDEARTRTFGPVNITLRNEALTAASLLTSAQPPAPDPAKVFASGAKVWVPFSGD